MTSAGAGGIRALTGLFTGFGRDSEPRLIANVDRRRKAFAQLDMTEVRAIAQRLRGRADADIRSNEWTVECLALACEAAKRAVLLDPDPVQVLAALQLRRGRVIQMATGEGKTLVAALAACVSATAHRRVHVVTANDYLAARDAHWMSPLYALLGLVAGIRQGGQSDEERRAAHAHEIVYGTASELGFDWLMDGVRRDADARISRPYDFGIIDEVDHILIDEASNPLTITADLPVDDAACRAADGFAANAREVQLSIDRPRRTVWLTDLGFADAERWFSEHGLLGDGGLDSLQNLALANRMTQALHARLIMRRDIDYVVLNDTVMVMDQRTGRPTRGRFPDGLQQALEMREGVPLTPEQRAMAALSLRAFAKLYRHCCGMTGTAAADAAEFAEVYGLQVAEIPRALPSRRIDHGDRIYPSASEKMSALLEFVAARNARGQPILIGASTIPQVEAIGSALTARGLRHRTLHALRLDEEAAIVGDAGRPGAITVATLMAGRGTDIELGGRGEALAARARGLAEAAGGLLVVGAERQRLRRLDEQLRGRAGRRGDPGESIFFVSHDDDLLAPLRGEKLRALAAASARGEDGRLLDADLPKLVAAVQAKNRESDAAGRRSARPYDEILDLHWRVFQDAREPLLLPERPQAADIELVLHHAASFARATPPRTHRMVAELARRMVPLLDEAWQEHVVSLGELRQGIGWRAVGGRDPLIEYKKEALAGLERMLDRARAAMAAALTAAA
jgi:preprotein translocase subunit SecA